MQRYDIINYLIKKYSFSRYLEIGIFNGENIRRIEAETKHGVDPGHEGTIAPEVTHQCTSDTFFESIDKNVYYDIIFIDGLHHCDQVVLDIKNSLRHLSHNGFIVLHDCVPPDYDSQIVPRKTNVWTGDVWRAMVGFRSKNKHSSWVVDTDLGIGIIKNNEALKEFSSSTIDYEEFVVNKKFLLNLISIQEFVELNI